MTKNIKNDKSLNNSNRLFRTEPVNQLMGLNKFIIPLYPFKFKTFSRIFLFKYISEVIIIFLSCCFAYSNTSNIS